MTTLLFSTSLIILASTTIFLLNRLLNNLALNHWHFTAQGSTFDFSSNKELAIVTGGSSGFGKLIALGLAPHAKVVVLDIADLPAELLSSPNITFRKCDLTSPKDVHNVAATIKAEHGTPSILINNAGIATSHTILDTSDEWLEKIFRVNVLSHFSLIREFLPGMLALGKGHVITMASMAAYASTANLVDYSATKSAALALHNGESSPLSFHMEQDQLNLVRPNTGAPPSLPERAMHSHERLLPNVGTYTVDQDMGVIFEHASSTCARSIGCCGCCGEAGAGCKVGACIFTVAYCNCGWDGSLAAVVAGVCARFAAETDCEGDVARFLECSTGCT